MHLLIQVYRVCSAVAFELYICLVFIGYAFVLGTVVAKLWRVYHIFHEPTTTNKVIHDWQLVIVIAAIVGVQCLLLLLGLAIPMLRPTPYLRENLEKLSILKDPTTGVEIRYLVYACYVPDTPSYYWLIVLIVYIAILQCAGILLAFQTRKVKIPVLNDSKYIAAIIYISSITLVTLMFTHFGLSGHLDVNKGIFNALVFINTSACLGLIFIPKMVSLYQDPSGDKIFEKTLSAAAVAHPGSTDRTTKARLKASRSEHPPNTLIASTSFVHTAVVGTGK